MHFRGKCTPHLGLHRGRQPLNLYLANSTIIISSITDVRQTTLEIKAKKELTFKPIKVNITNTSDAQTKASIRAVNLLALSQGHSASEYDGLRVVSDTLGSVEIDINSATYVDTVTSSGPRVKWRTHCQIFFPTTAEEKQIIFAFSTVLLNKLITLTILFIEIQFYPSPLTSKMAMS